jgi:hypothetical protein
MLDREFLILVLARLHYVYGEEVELDYMTKLASIIDRTHPAQMSANVATSSRVRELIENHG